jgi:hypothetical protein
MFWNPIIGMIHNVAQDTWHPVLFCEAPLPGPPSPEKPVRHKSKMHHTAGFATREEAEANVRDEFATAVAEHADRAPRLALSHPFDWDGEGIPVIVEFFDAGADGELVPAFETSHARA